MSKVRFFFKYGAKMKLCTQLALSQNKDYISALKVQILALETIGGLKLSNISPWEAILTTGRIPTKTTVSLLTGQEEHH